MREPIHVAAASAFTEMKPICVAHEGIPYVIIQAQGKLNAFVSFCTHKDLVMDPPRLEKDCLVCPHHRVSFDPTSGDVVDSRGKTVPQGLIPVELFELDGQVYLECRNKHRKLVPKKQRRKVERNHLKT